jgi:tetratricopeptide (TPR) repeat protein
VIVYSKETFPENYLDASKAWYALRTENGIERAQSLLIEGIEELGNNIVLYNKLIANYVDLGDYSSAINFQKKVVDFSHRKERGYLKLANLQMLQKNYTEAVKSIELAKKYYSDLPNRIKHTKFMKQFYSELEQKEEKLKNEIIK